MLYPSTDFLQIAVLPTQRPLALCFEDSYISCLIIVLSQNNQKHIMQISPFKNSLCETKINLEVYCLANYSL